MRNLIAPIAAVAALLAASPALAHDEMPVTGQVVAVGAKTIQVRTKEGQTVTLQVDGNTRVAKDGQRRALADLKVGQTVKALGFGDSMTDLIAIDVTITAPGKGG
ncbi:MAG: hypothetical protein ACOY9C_08345 [Pseudomonadota bacterium]